MQESVPVCRWRIDGDVCGGIRIKAEKTRLSKQSKGSNEMKDSVHRLVRSTQIIDLDQSQKMSRMHSYDEYLVTGKPYISRLVLKVSTWGMK
jgi:hypothetical protein